MPNVFIVMGHRNARKSATIRALTGAPQKGDCKISTQANVNGIDVYIQISALQESTTMPEEFVNLINDEGWQNVLICLRIDARISAMTTYPNGLDYVQKFIDANWDITSIVVLGVDPLPYNLPPNAPPPNFIPDSVNLPANQIASQIRNLWHWL